MRVALHAPMKPLDDPVPSGDRQMGRLIATALGNLGHDVIQPTRFRSWSKTGGIQTQRAIEQAALVEADRLIALFARGDMAAPHLWLTYHLYHKAPDWIGPRIADALDIPYVVVEASRAAKRRSGEWAHGFAAADAGLARADAVAVLHGDDGKGVAPIVPGERLFLLPPFIDAAGYRPAPRNAATDTGALNLLAVAMMRDGDKMRSYQILGEALSMLRDLDWRLTLVGDGPRRDDVLALFPAERIDWRGSLSPTDVAALYAGADLFVWPAIREAFGLVFLEAQACGVPVIAGSTGGVKEIVRHGESGWLVPVGDAGAFAAAIRHAYNTRAGLADMGLSAAAHIRARHDIASASRNISRILDVARAAHAGDGASLSSISTGNMQPVPGLDGTHDD